MVANGLVFAVEVIDEVRSVVGSEDIVIPRDDRLSTGDVVAGLESVETTTSTVD